MDVFLDKIMLPFLVIVSVPLATFLAAQLTLLAKRITAKAGIELSDVQEERLRRQIRGHILHTQQTFVKNARIERGKDGHLSGDDALKAMRMTMRTSVEALGKKGLAALANVTGKGEAALRDVVEEEVAALKLIPKASGNPPA